MAYGFNVMFTFAWPHYGLFNHVLLLPTRELAARAVCGFRPAKSWGCIGVLTDQGPPDLRVYFCATCKRRLQQIGLTALTHSLAELNGGSLPDVEAGLERIPGYTVQDWSAIHHG